MMLSMRCLASRPPSMARTRTGFSTRPVCTLVFGLAILICGSWSGVLPAQDVSPVDPELEQRVEGSSPMPHMLPSTDIKRPPTFVAADLVLLPDGTVDPALFRPGEERAIQRHLALKTSGGCIRQDFFSSYHLPADAGRSPIEERIHESENTILAKVTGRIYGYKASEPGTLLRVEMEEALSGEAHGSTHFIHFPVGNFEMGDFKICRTTEGFPNPPEIGDRVLLFYYDSTYSPRTEFLNIRAPEVVVLPQSGPIRFSSFLSSDVTKSSPVESDYFVELVRSWFTHDSQAE